MLLKKIYDKFTFIEKTVLAILFTFLTCAVVFDVLRRKLMGVSLPWIEEFGRYSLVFCTMVCASMGITTDSHARMDAVVGLLHGKVLKVVRILSNIIPSAGCFYLAYWGYVHVSKMIKAGTMATALPLPLWIFYAIMPVCLIGIAVRSLVLVFNDVRNFNKTDEKKHTELDDIQAIETTAGEEGETK